MDEGGFAPWIRMGAQPTARMDVYVPCLHEFLRERQQPPLLAESDVPAASGCPKVQPLELDAAPTGRAPAAQASLVIPGAHGPQAIGGLGRQDQG